MKNILQKFKVILMHPATFILAATSAFFAFDKLSVRADSALADIIRTDRSSVTFVGGHYKVDTLVIRNNINKNRLVADAEKQVLKRKNTIDEVPSFIWRFLDSISYDRKFEIVNPGEEWKEGITDYGHLIFKKVYDPSLNDSVPFLSGDGAVLPNKQLVYFGMSDNIALMSFFHGGLGPHTNIIIFKHKNNRVTDFWYGGASSEAGINTKNELIKNLKLKPKNDGC